MHCEAEIVDVEGHGNKTKGTEHEFMEDTARLLWDPLSIPHFF